VICFSLLAALPAGAKNADGLCREINAELRNAQNLMFKGKAREAQGLLENIQSKMEQLRAADPNLPNRGLAMWICETSRGKQRFLNQELER